jgi:FKBP12-rapamycin complex-associated protein
LAAESSGRYQLLARCYLKLGQWESAIIDQHTEASINKILGSLHHATQYDDKSYKAWHTWALMNFEAVAHYEKSRETTKVEVLEVCAAQGMVG